MAKAIPKSALALIADTIRNWPADQKLSWEAVCTSAKLYLDYVPTRQALSAKSELSIAFKIRKRDFIEAASAKSSTPVPKSMAAAIEKIANLQAEIQALQAANAILHEVLQHAIHNAALKGMSKSELMKNIPKPNRKLEPDK